MFPSGAQHDTFSERSHVALKIQESGENYLETILILEQKNGVVRSIDIANELCDIEEIEIQQMIFS